MDSSLGFPVTCERQCGITVGIIISAIAQGVDFCHATCCGYYVAVGIVDISCDHITLYIYDGHHIALQVGDVVVQSTVVLQGIRRAAIVEEVKSIGAVSFSQQSAACIVVDALGIVDGFAGSQAVDIVGKIPGGLRLRWLLSAACRGPTRRSRWSSFQDCTAS